MTCCHDDSHGDFVGTCLPGAKVTNLMHHPNMLSDTAGTKEAIIIHVNRSDIEKFRWTVLEANSGF